MEPNNSWVWVAVVAAILLPWSSAASTTADSTVDLVGLSPCAEDTPECGGQNHALLKLHASLGSDHELFHEADDDHGHGNDADGCDNENAGQGQGPPACDDRPRLLDYSVGVNASATFLLGNEFVELAVEASSDSEERTAANATADGGRVHEPPSDDQRDPLIACRDARGCPDLVVDSTKMLAGSDVVERSFGNASCAVLEGSVQPGERRLLRFTFTTPNLGEGDLRVGNVEDNLDLFVFDSCHAHYHFAEYADYRLWTLDGYADWQRVRAKYPNASAESVFASNPWLLDGFVAGHKQGFCVIDIVNYVPGESARYGNCFSNQGITRGWADEYHRSLTGQWVDITDVADGFYVLEAEVNAERIYKEADYSNNAGTALVLVSPVNTPPIGPVPPLPVEPPDAVKDLLGDLIEFP